MAQHLEEVDLRRLLDDTLEPEAADRAMEHLSECETCQGEWDRLWQELRPDALEALSVAEPAQDESAAERGVLRRVHLGDLLVDAVTMVFHGFGLLFRVALIPFESSAEERERSTRRSRK